MNAIVPVTNVGQDDETTGKNLSQIDEETSLGDEVEQNSENDETDAESDVASRAASNPGADSAATSDPENTDSDTDAPAGAPSGATSLISASKDSDGVHPVSATYVAAVPIRDSDIIL